MKSKIFTKGFMYSATICFKNGSTSGRHKIEDCENLADAYIKAKAFVENL